MPGLGWVRALIITALVTSSLLHARSALACGLRMYGAVSDHWEMGDDASRVGDFALAIHYYEDGLRIAHQLPAISPWRRCAATISRSYVALALRRRAYFDERGRSTRALAETQRFTPDFPHDFNCP
ncbi:MAG: hypothetical protein GIX03_10150 [Candidatus Eremiobacteraeota bacterium]|nr:hypothetical protein [Candidatus Eremiobacteraeota bacterium]MBC5803332.1 hypothetical protein [Candidatus Eremiobacteraeota bacterium]MBC5822854.1 hypothetical protein [Candidatus Eremiobacteraeota bacterium]